MRRYLRLTFVLSVLLLALSGMTTASAASTSLSYTVGGDASVAPNGITMNSIDGSDSYAAFNLPPGGVDIAQLQYVGTEHEVLLGNCGGGSPRFALRRDDGKNAFLYIGDHPNFTNCADGDTGNLLASTDTRCDFTQMGGPFYGDCADLPSYFANAKVTAILLAVDGSWMANQSFLMNPTVTVDPGAPPSKDACKNGWWEYYGFKNQGQCVSSVVANPKSGKN
jgi:hypothetical protein